MTLEKLRKIAIKIAMGYGHNLRPFSRKYRHWWNSECRNCGKKITIRDNPAPHESSISGEEVVETVCNKS